MKNIVKLIGNDIVYNKFYGDQNAEEMQELIGENQHLVRGLQNQNIRPKFLGDISELKHLSVEARRLAIDSFKRSTRYEKVAIVGANRIFKYLLSFMAAGLSSVGKIKLFDGEAEAIDWLRGDL